MELIKFDAVGAEFRIRSAGDRHVQCPDSKGMSELSVSRLCRSSFGFVAATNPLGPSTVAAYRRNAKSRRRSVF